MGEKEHDQNPAELLADWIRATFPQVAVTVTTGLKSDDLWHVDVEKGPLLLSIDWAPGTRVFAVVDNSETALGGDRGYESKDAAYSHVADLLSRHLGL